MTDNSELSTRSAQTSASGSASPHGKSGRDRIMSAMPWLSLAISAIWLVVIFVTDLPAWPLALWIAISLGPLTVLRSRFGRTSEVPAG